MPRTINSSRFLCYTPGRMSAYNVIRRLAIFVLGLVACGALEAATISLPSNRYGAVFPPGWSIGESFQAPASETLLQSFTYDFYGGPFSDHEGQFAVHFTANLQQFDPNSGMLIGPVLYASGPQVLTGPAPYDNPVTWSGISVALNPAAHYLMYITSLEPVSDVIVAELHYSSISDYPNGGFFFRTDSSVTFTGPQVPGSPYNNVAFDATFGAIPEPNTAILIAFSLLVSGAIRVRALRRNCVLRRK